jgi:hypothetical protein
MAESENGKYFWLLENDGHNRPSFWRFRNQEQAERWLLKQNLEYKEACSTDPSAAGFLSDDSEGSFEDSEGTTWTTLDGPLLPVIDMTGDDKDI